MLIRKLLRIGHGQAEQELKPELETNSAQQPPWQRPGWLDEVTTWIRQQLEIQGIDPETISIQTVKQWSISCVLEVQTPTQKFFFKQASPYPPLFCHEPAVTTTLSQLFPEQMPTVVACENQQQWLLLKDFGSPLGHRASVQQQQSVYGQFAQLQLQSVQDCDRLLSAGCIDRSLATLQKQIGPLLNDNAALSELSNAEAENLQSLEPKLKRACAQLSNYRIPETLVHGDLHLNNVALNQGNYIFFDWTDACISHPFFDGTSLYFLGQPQNFIERLFRKNLSNRRCQIQSQLCHHYLSFWKSYESEQRLQEAWEIAKPLCALHHAITYQTMAQALEPSDRPQMQVGVTSYLRRLLQSVDG